MKKVIKIQYRKQNEKETAPWQQLNTLDEIVWDGRYDIRVKNHDISMSLPFTLGVNDTATLVVKDYSHIGRLQHSRTIVQTMSKVEQEDGKVLTYSRTYYKTDGKHKWSEWRQSANAAGEAGNENAIIWNDNSHIDTYTTAGVYSITGERTNATDGLPFSNAAPGHTFHARLVVLDSSIPGTGQSDDKCITQMLMLSNRTGGDGDIYVRTGRAATKEQLDAGNGWEMWGKMQQNVQVGVVPSLDNFTDNGIYSGIYISGNSVYETFVMVVINNYVAATATGKTRCISQFKYALNTDSNFGYKTRTGRGTTNIEWGSWVDLGAAKTSDIQDSAITAQKLSADVREKVEKVPSLEENAAKEKNALVNGDTIVGLAREVYSRQGKVDTATFFKRTTAGGTSVSDGVATLKQIGGNIVKNYVDASFIGNETLGVVNGHIYYFSTSLFNGQLHFAETSTGVYSGWKQHSIISKATSDSITIAIEGDKALNTLLINLTEMFGAGKEPTKEDCDKMFGTMDALPQGLTIAQPTGLKSTGYNQWNPENVLINKIITDNAIVDGDKNIAIVECLPCKTGAGENNGYVIGYGEGDDWSDEGVEVYLSPLNPLDVGNGAELYMHKLEKDSTYGTYVPLIKGCLLVVTPTTDKLCAHLHWSGDKAKTDYEEYVESYVALPTIPEMSELGLAGISTSGTLAADTIDLDRMVYTKRVGCVDMGSLNYSYSEANNVFNLEPYINKGFNFKGGGAILASAYTTASAGYADSARPDKTIYAAYNKILRIYINDSSYTDAESFKASLQGVMLYYELAEPEEYPIVTKTAPNYIGSDYGVEEFTGSKIPLAANILFYMRSLVSETRNFLDRLMAGLGVSDATTAADKIVASIADGI